MNDEVEVKGTVTCVFPGGIFRVKLEDGRETLIHVTGKMRKRYALLTVGDTIVVRMPPSGPDDGQQPAVISPKPTLPPDTSARAD
jgi:translation initiation factor IF-1